MKAWFLQEAFVLKLLSDLSGDHAKEIMKMTATRGSHQAVDVVGLHGDLLDFNKKALGVTGEDFFG